MTDKQPDALRLADAVFAATSWVPAGAPARKTIGDAAALLRTQHADLLRKDALLKQALETLENDVQLHCYLPSRQHHLETIASIVKELQ